MKMKEKRVMLEQEIEEMENLILEEMNKRGMTISNLFEIVNDICNYMEENATL